MGFLIPFSQEFDIKPQKNLYFKGSLFYKMEILKLYFSFKSK